MSNPGVQSNGEPPEAGPPWLLPAVADEDGDEPGAAGLEAPDDALAAELEADGPPQRAALPVGASDEQLAAWVTAIVDRDERALTALYDATVSRVFGLVQRIVRNPALAEEVVEDAYFQVWRQAVRFDPVRGKALTWLLAVARSRAIDALRREARFRHESLDEASQTEPTSAEPGADDLLDLARNRADLHQALMLLGAQPRQLVSLAFFRGLSHEEIAQHTQLPLGTVKSQIRRALTALRQTLGDGRLPAMA